ncbi:hypothetical protein H0H93_008964 [Arthromyces matolae]|nr:hypothetical protein H0H93_008964 [Arthromyces matolae]
MGRRPKNQPPISSPAEQISQDAANEKGSGRRGARDKDDSLPSSVAQLEAARSSVHNEYGRPENTRVAYDRYYIGGQTFLANLVAERRRCLVQDNINNDLLALAFGPEPNQYSALALEYYITEKCCVQLKGKDTANGIQAAWADFWDNVPRSRAREECYWYDQDANKVHGSPARAPSVKALVRDLNKKAKVEGTRNHAEAIDIHVVQKVLDWSEKEVPRNVLKNLPPVYDGRRYVILRHAAARAIFATGFTLWTRHSELANLKVGDLIRHLRDDPDGPLFMKVHIHHRKGWENKSGKAGEEGMTYEIPDRPDSKPTNMYLYMEDWLLCRRLATGKDPDPEEVIFPSIERNDTSLAFIV